MNSQAHARKFLRGLALLAGMTVSTPALAFTLSGTVTTQSGNQPVSGVDVRLFTGTGVPIGIPPTLTNGSGFYSVTGIPAGSYQMQFVPPASTGLLHLLVTGISVSGNTTVDAQLEAGNILSGFVRNTSLSPLAGIDINVYEGNGTKLETPGDNSDLTGFYDVVVPNGSYLLRWRSLDTLARWVTYEIDNVDFNDNNQTIDVTLESGWFVSGTVTGPGSVPVVNANLDFLDVNTQLVVPTPNDNTNGQGHYRVLVPPRTYDVTASAQPADHLFPGSRTGFVVTKDTTLNFQLQPVVFLTGLVRNSLSVGVVGADIDVRDPVTGVKLLTPGDNTGVGGAYSISFPAGTYDLDYQPPVASGLAPVRLAGVVLNIDTAINVTVPNGLLLSGLVRRPGAIPVQGVDIDVKYAATGAVVPVVGDLTDVTGAFAVVIPVGMMDVEIEPPPALRLTPKLLAGISPSGDTSVVVTLDTGLVISGTVFDNTGTTPLPGVRVRAVDASTGDTVFTPSGTTDPLGQYQLLAPPDTYLLRYSPGTGSGLADTVLTGVIVSKDTVINVTFGASTADVRGDVNNNGSTTSSDIIYLVNYVFKGGPPPLPVVSEGDVNCSATITSSDVIFLVNYVFKGGPTPVCP